jgi:imidazolonepropionase-like amidohydrolase
MNLQCDRYILRFVLVGSCASVFAIPRLAVPQEAPSAKTMAAPPSGPLEGLVENGKFTLHKFEQPIGQETYEITGDGESLSVKIEFKFTDRGSAVPLTTTFRSENDLTPFAFEIKGKNSRVSTIDQAVEVQPEKVRVRDRDKWTDAPRPKQFFTIAGYAPATMQMLMVRYWATHGSPAELATLPSGRVKIEPRGQDTLGVDGKNDTFNRYTIEGLIWGRETLWFDSSHNLVAAVTIDAESDHFEAIREGYESALSKFVGIAGSDGMAALAEISKGISGSRSDSIAVVGGTLIDGTGREPVPDSVVVIEKGRIAAAGPRAKVKIPHDATLVDAHGKTVFPGLWDMHAHFEQVEWGPIYLAAGVTTVRDCGNELEFITAVRDAIKNSKGLGPQLLLAGIVDGSAPEAIGVARVDTPEQAKMWVQRYHDAGFQQIKIYSSVKLDEIKVIAEEAHRVAMTVTGHVPEGLNAFETIEAGQDQINHVQYVLNIMHAPYPEKMDQGERRKAMANLDLQSPEAAKAVAFLKSHGTVVDPTLAVYEFDTANTAKPTVSFEPGVARVAVEMRQSLTDVGPPSPTAEIQEKILQKRIEVTGMLHRAGVPIIAGTDQTVPGHSLYREIELYVQAGFTPMEAIQAATIVPARVMGLDKEVGTVEPGKRADLILVDGDPLESIHNIRNVKYVIADGKMYDCAELWRSVGFKP